jgi:hypothetical protein
MVQAAAEFSELIIHDEHLIGQEIYITYPKLVALAAGAGLDGRSCSREAGNCCGEGDDTCEGFHCAAGLTRKRLWGAVSDELTGTKTEKPQEKEKLAEGGEVGGCYVVLLILCKEQPGSAA